MHLPWHAGGYGLYLAKEEGCLSVSSATPAASQYDVIRPGLGSPAPAPGPASDLSQQGKLPLASSIEASRQKILGLVLVND